MRKQAAVEERQGRLFIQSWDETTGSYPLSIQGSWLESTDDSASDETVGEFVRSALSQSRNGIPVHEVESHVKESRKQLLKVAGARSESQYEKGMRHVEVTWDEAEANIVLTPYRNMGWREGITPMTDAVIEVEAHAEPSVLGRSVRRALELAVPGPQ